MGKLYAQHATERNQTIMKPQRNWQIECLGKIVKAKDNGHKDFLVYAGVGAGKTRLALDAFKDSSFERLVIYTYTTALVEQWIESDFAKGINLLGLENKKLAERLPVECQGFVSTYAAMGKWPDMHAIKCSEKRTMVVFDEIHHLSEEEGVWGDAARIAAGSASFRLHLTGTPLRTDRTKIPFVPYKEEGEQVILDLSAKNSFQCSYGECVAQGYCAQVEFIPYDGEVRWRKLGKDHEASFETDLPKIQHGDRKRAAISFDDFGRNDFVEKLLLGAWSKLRDFRSEKEDAAGLIACQSQAHAKMVSDLLYRITKQKPIVVISEDKESADKISAFREGSSPWIVSVKMVSEGVDIPRLRLAVYLSNEDTDLFYWQFMGRIVRSPGKIAAFFYPKHPKLHEWACRVEEEVEAVFAEKQFREGGGEGGGESDFKVHGGFSEERDHVIGGETIPVDVSRVAFKLGKAVPELAGMDFMEIVRIAKMAKEEFKGELEEDLPPQESYSSKKKRLTGALSSAIKKYVGSLYRNSKPPEEAWKEEQNKANEFMNVRIRSSASLEALERCIVHYEELYEANRNGI